MYSLQVSVVQRKAERLLQPMHLEQRIQPAILLIGGTAGEWAGIAENRHDRSLQCAYQPAAIEQIDLVVEIGKVLRPVADNAIFEKCRAVGARKGYEEVIVEACSFRHVLQPALQFGFQLAGGNGGGERKSVILCAVSGCALTSCHRLVLSRGPSVRVSQGKRYGAGQQQDCNDAPRRRDVRHAEAIFD